MKKVFIIMPFTFVVFLAFVGFLAINNVKHENDLILQIENKVLVEMPDFAFEELNGNGFLTKDDFYSDGYSLLNVFASWCKACLLEHETLLELSKKKGLKVFGVAFRDIDENSGKYLQDFGNPYLKVGVDRRGEMSRLLSVKAIPESFLINGDGKIIYRHQGILDKDVILKFVKKINVEFD